MEVIFLGTGTSTGIPIIGCGCRVCNSSDSRDKRTRPGILLRKDGYNLLVDASAELRIQLLRENIRHIDSIFITHPHADHIFGLDDTRVFSLKNKKPMPIYCSLSTEKEIRRVYDYVFRDTQEGGGKPSFEFRRIEKTKRIGPFEIYPFKVWHGNILIDAIVADNLIIIFDASYIEPDTLRVIKESGNYGIINGLRMRPHSTHFSFAESSALLCSLNVTEGYILHLTHDFMHDDIEKMTPENIHPAYDGLRIIL
ncbi:MAG: MBL fold metallo-hydrolase [candidate division WOR-3 bacterium]|nr:MBL fold metallo-hydrolase [candidate division WOR-3 bacterium]